MSRRRTKPVLSDVLRGLAVGHRRSATVPVPVQLLVDAATAIERQARVPDWRACIAAQDDIVTRADKVLTKFLSIYNHVTKVGR